jgi:hypothetical protein
MNKLLLGLVAIFLFAACNQTPNLIGKWNAIGEPGTLEFYENGLVEMVDNMGATFKGRYEIGKSGNVRLTFIHHDILSDHVKPMDEPVIVNGKIYEERKELILTTTDTKESLKYKR